MGSLFCVLEQARHSSSATMKLKEPLHFDNLQRASLTPAAFLCVVCMSFLLSVEKHLTNIWNYNIKTQSQTTNTFFLPDLHEKNGTDAKTVAADCQLAAGHLKEESRASCVNQVFNLCSHNIFLFCTFYKLYLIHFSQPYWYSHSLRHMPRGCSDIYFWLMITVLIRPKPK